MRILKDLILIITAVWKVSRCAFELPGNSSMGLDKEPETPKSEDDLRQEVGGRLPEKIFEVFRRGVAYHRRELYEEALGEYKKLRQIPLQDGGVFDLHTQSEVFRHNWDLLSKAIKPISPLNEDSDTE